MILVFVCMCLSLCVCVFMKLHITGQSGPVISHSMPLWYESFRRGDRESFYFENL